MLNFPPPPSPPHGGDQLLTQLADYYRQLVEYHQRAAELATIQLNHVEALLNPGLDFRTIYADITPDSTPKQLADIDSLIEITFPDQPESQQDIEDKSEQNLLVADEEVGEERPTITEDIVHILESNRGKVLHINYIVRKLYGVVNSEELSDVTNATKKLLEEGEKQGKWYKMPDTPECWTVDLQEFPDLLEQMNSGMEVTKTYKHSYERLPYTKKLERYESMMDMVAHCLQEHHPLSMSAEDILKWLYPEGIALDSKQRAVEAINGTLTKGIKTRGWRRVMPGRYVWVERR